MCGTAQKEKISLSKEERSKKHLENLFKRGKDFLQSDYPILCGAMTWISESNLVSAIANAGGFGMLACGAMDPGALEKEIALTQEKTEKSFGANLIVFHKKIQDLMEVCIKNKVTHVCFAGGLPTKASIHHLKDHGIKTIGFAPSFLLGKKLISMGIDALIIEGSEAGGHIGFISTNVLAQEILPHIKDVPVFVAGGIGSGLSMFMFMQMGASGCQLGTRFVCAQESIAHPKFKEAFLKAHSRDAVPSPQLDARFPIIPVRALKNMGTEKFLALQKEVISQFDGGEISREDAQMRIELFWAGALRRAVIEGDTEYGSLMAGQSVGMVKRIEPCENIIKEFLKEIINALED